MHSLEQMTFDYGLLTPEQAQRTQDAELRIIGRTQKTIAENGKDLLTVKADIGHGHFTNWLHSIGISDNTAERWMNVAKVFGEIPPGGEFTEKAMALLSTSKVSESARDEAKQRAADGEKITEEIARQIRDAHRAKEEAEEKADLAQQQLFEAQSRSQEVFEQLNSQIEALQQQIETISKPEVQVQEVQVVPPEMKAQIEKLQDQVKTLTEQREKLAKKAEQLGEENRQAFLKRNMVEQEQKFRMAWRKTTQDFQDCAGKLLSQMLTQTHNHAFEAEDWDRLAQAREIARRFIAECDNLSRGTPEIVVDAVTINAD